MRRPALLAAAALVVLASTLAARAADPAAPLTGAVVQAELDAGRAGAAVVKCEEADKAQALADDARPACAQALVLLGDRLHAAGSPDNAKRRWLQATSFDPRLLDDEAFQKKLAGAPDLPPKLPDQPVVKPPARPEPKPAPKPEPRRKVPPGPRHDRSLGVGLSAGFDGFLALDLGWLVDEHWLIEVAFGLVYPTTDVRFRWLGMRSCVTPYLGAGIIVPFGAEDRFGLDVSGFQALYELGEAVHVDMGLAWTPVHSLDLYAGVAFLTPFDQDHPDTVVFFPQFSLGASWYF